MNKLHTYLKKGDIFIIILALILSVSVFLFAFLYKPNQKICVIKESNKIVKTIPLTDKTNEKIIIDKKYENVIIIKNGEVYISHSTCPNQICVNTGKISKVSQSIVCLPNKILIEIVGSKNEQEVDLIAQ